MKYISLTLCLCVLAVLTGCTTPDKAVPRTHISAFLGGKPCAAEFPKDFKAEKVSFIAETNGSLRLEMVNVDARMNPDVISMTGEAYVKMRDADSRLMKQAFDSGTSAVGAIGSAALK